jgi:hypothetical protein
MKPLYIAKLLLTLLVILSAKCFSSEYIYLGGWSYHTNEHPRNGDTITANPNSRCHKYGACIEGINTEEFNNDHHLIGYQKNGYMVAHFDNSFNQSTWLLVRHFEKQHEDFPVAFIAQIGATNGYTDCDFEDSGKSAKTCPYYQFGFALTKFKIQPTFSTSGSVFMMSFRYKL